MGVVCPSSWQSSYSESGEPSISPASQGAAAERTGMPPARRLSRALRANVPTPPARSPASGVTSRCRRRDCRSPVPGYLEDVEIWLRGKCAVLIVARRIAAIGQSASRASAQWEIAADTEIERRPFGRTVAARRPDAVVGRSLWLPRRAVPPKDERTPRDALHGVCSSSWEHTRRMRCREPYLCLSRALACLDGCSPAALGVHLGLRPARSERGQEQWKR